MNAPARTPQIGDNRLPLVTAEQLTKDFAHVEAFIVEIEAEATKAPPVLEDDEDLAAVNALVPKLRAAAKRCDALREEQKRPHLEAGRVIDTFFKTLDGRLATLQRGLEARATQYLHKKAEAEAARRRAEEERLRREAAAKAQEAAEAARAGHTEQAAIAQAAAAEAQTRAEDAATPVKPAELARTQTAAGTATLEQRWEFEIVDFDKVDLNALRPYFTRADLEKAIRAFVRAGRHELAGVHIFPTTNARMR